MAIKLNTTTLRARNIKTNAMDDIRMLHAEGKSLLQIKNITGIRKDDVETILLENGIRPIFTVHHNEQEHRTQKEIKAYMESMRVLGVPLNQRNLHK